MRPCSGLLFAGLFAAASPSLSQAQDSAPFYKDKQIRLIISAGVAGGYMEYARALADQMGKHIAGNPSILVQSMPGAGGLNATNFLYTNAPQDGTYIGMVHSTIPLSPLWGSQGVRFETMKFNWIGAFDRAPGVCLMWRRGRSKPGRIFWKRCPPSAVPA